MITLPATLLEKYARQERDVDAEMFWEAFDLNPPAMVLEVGCNDSYVSNQLAELGFSVMGVDLREYGAGGLKVGPKFMFRQADFVKMPFEGENVFHAAVSLSAIEHFGLGTFSAETYHEDYDVQAMQRIRRLLVPGGLAYITVPYSAHFVEWGTDWRVYDAPALQERICAGFEVVSKTYFASHPVTDPQRDGIELFPEGARITQEEADEAPVYPPHTTCLVVLRKAEADG